MATLCTVLCNYMLPFAIIFVCAVLLSIWKYIFSKLVSLLFSKLWNLLDRILHSSLLVKVSRRKKMGFKLWLFQVNNITNTLNPRYRSIVSGAWTEFVLMVKDVRPRDSGTYECQVSRVLKFFF